MPPAGLDTLREFLDRGPLISAGLEGRLELEPVRLWHEDHDTTGVPSRRSFFSARMAKDTTWLVACTRTADDRAGTRCLVGVGG